MNVKISYGMIMSVVGLIFVLILSIIMGVIAFSRGGLVFVPFLASLAYFAFVVKQVYDEWKNYKLDKEKGVETAELEFLDFDVGKSSSGMRYTRGSRVKLAAFKEESKEGRLVLRGRFFRYRIKTRKYVQGFVL